MFEQLGRSSGIVPKSRQVFGDSLRVCHASVSQSVKTGPMASFPRFATGAGTIVFVSRGFVQVVTANED
jgi:hypothetical protein